MSSANQVPTTWKLEGDDSRSTLAKTGRIRLIRDAFVRLRAADGFSHARSLAFATVLVIVQAVIALVGLAAALNAGGISDLIVKTMRSIAPGPAGSVLTQAVTQAHQAGSSHRSLALVLGTVGAFITACTLMGQMERGLNRMYGIERDRPTVRKYARAFVLVVSAGVAVAVAFTAMTFGHQIAASLGSDLAIRVWGAIRWPIGVILLTLAIALVFRWSPHRRQPTWSWLAFGSAVSVILWVAVTVLLGLFFRYSSTFGRTYGPLAGIVALILWSLLSSVAVLFGGAIAAQLEAVRAGVPSPRREAPEVEILPSTRRQPVPAGERR